MMMTPYNQEQETEIVHEKNLTEAFFSHLFEQFKIKENNQKELESLLLEMNLSNINLLKLKGKKQIFKVQRIH